MPLGHGVCKQRVVMERGSGTLVPEVVDGCSAIASFVIECLVNRGLISLPELSLSFSISLFVELAERYEDGAEGNCNERQRSYGCPDMGGQEIETPSVRKRRGEPDETANGCGAAAKAIIEASVRLPNSYAFRAKLPIRSPNSTASWTRALNSRQCWPMSVSSFLNGVIRDPRPRY